MIVGEIKRFLRDGNSLRIARSIRDTAYQVLKTRSEMEKRDQEATIEKIAEQMHGAVSEVVYALDAISDTVSLYDPVYNKAGDTLTLVDQLGDNKNTDDNWTEKVALDTAVKSLSEREKNIIRLRYYEGKTQTEISRQVGISQAQVSRLEKNALSMIKERIRVMMITATESMTDSGISTPQLSTHFTITPEKFSAAKALPRKPESVMAT